MSTKLKIVKSEAFNVTACGNNIVEDLITLKGAEAARDSLNRHLGEALANKAVWGSQKTDGSLGQVIGTGLVKRGLTDGTVRTTLATVKWCFGNAVRVDTLTLSAMKERAAKGLVCDLITGKAKTVKAKPSKKAGRAKTQKTVDHCGDGMLKALEQEGFIKWLNHFMDAADIRGVDSTDVDEIKLDLVRDTLIECGFAVQEEKGIVAAIILESDNEEDA